MKEFEPTEESYVVRLIKEHTRQPEFGIVTKVFEHTEVDDASNFEANVKLRDADKERRRIPMATSPFMGGVAVPEVGDTVLVNFLDGDGESPVIVGVMHNAEDRAPVGQVGIYRLRKGELYFEMHPDGDWVRMAKKDEDDAEPQSKVELDQSGGITLDGYKPAHIDSFEVTGTGQISVTGVGFTPSMIEFSGEVTGGQNVDQAGSTSTVDYAGSFTGQARDDGHRQVSHSGGNGNSINEVSQYSSDTECIAIRYADSDGNAVGYLKADVVSWDDDGFTIDVSDFQQSEVVNYTAYR